MTNTYPRLHNIYALDSLKQLFCEGLFFFIIWIFGKKIILMLRRKEENMPDIKKNDRNRLEKIQELPRQNSLDELFEQAGKVLVEKQKGSVGLLQRSFRINYTRASEIMNQLEKAGVVGPDQGTRPREILMDRQTYDQKVNEWKSNSYETSFKKTELYSPVADLVAEPEENFIKSSLSDSVSPEEKKTEYKNNFNKFQNQHSDNEIPSPNCESGGFERNEGVFQNNSFEKTRSFVSESFKNGRSDDAQARKTSLNTETTGHNRNTFEERNFSIEPKGIQVPSMPERDRLFEEAGKIVVGNQKANISVIQRNLHVNFNYAASLMDQLEKAGVVGPDQGTKPREILMDEETYKRYLNTWDIPSFPQEREQPESNLGLNDVYDLSSSKEDLNINKQTEEKTAEYKETNNSFRENVQLEKKHTNLYADRNYALHKDQRVDQYIEQNSEQRPEQPSGQHIDFHAERQHIRDHAVEQNDNFAHNMTDVAKTEIMNNEPRDINPVFHIGISLSSDQFENIQQDKEKNIEKSADFKDENRDSGIEKHLNSKPALKPDIEESKEPYIKETVKKTDRTDVTDYLDWGTVGNKKQMEEIHTETEKTFSTIQGDKFSQDGLLGQAGKIVVEKQKGSIGLLQRSLHIDFSRAASLMNQLEKAGVVGPEQGTKPRAILMNSQAYEELLASWKEMGGGVKSQPDKAEIAEDSFFEGKTVETSFGKEDVFYSNSMFNQEDRTVQEDNSVSTPRSLKERDELFKEAGRIIIKEQCGNVELLQRTLHIDSNRAAQIMEQLEEAGVVSQKENIVLMDESTYHAMVVHCEDEKSDFKSNSSSEDTISMGSLNSFSQESLSEEKDSILPGAIFLSDCIETQGDFQDKVESDKISDSRSDILDFLNDDKEMDLSDSKDPKLLSEQDNSEELSVTEDLLKEIDEESEEYIAPPDEDVLNVLNDKEKSSDNESFIPPPDDKNKTDKADNIDSERDFSVAGQSNILINQKKYQPGRVSYKISNRTKYTFSTLGRSVNNLIAPEDPGKRKLGEAVSVGMDISEFLVGNAKTFAARGQQNLLAVQLNDSFQKLGIATITYAPRSVADLQVIINDLNKVLMKKGYKPINGSGAQMQVMILKMLKKGGLDKETEECLKCMLPLAKNKTLIEKPSRFRRITNMVLGCVKRSLKQTEAGQGLVFILDLYNRAKKTLYLGLSAMRAAMNSGRIASKLALKATLEAAVKVAKIEAKTAAGNVVVKQAESAAKTISQHMERVEERAKKKQERRQQKEKKRRDPFGIRSKTAEIKQSVKNKLLSKIPDRVKNNKAVQAISSIRNKLANKFASMSAAVHQLTHYLALFAFFLLLLIFLYIIIDILIMSIAGAFDASSVDEDIRIKILEQIQDSYTEQLNYIDSLNSQYDEVNIIFNDVKSDSYDEEEHMPSESFIETTNSAEILSMALIYFDYDLEDADESEVLNYVRQLYNGSHQLTVKTSTEIISVDEETEETETWTTATVTLTTYYFDQLFDCSLMDSYSVITPTLSGGSVELQVWLYFTQLGFSEESTAGIMGNIYQESKFDSTLLQNGHGPAAGLFQWENYLTKSSRWLSLYNFATARGTDWTDLQTQLDYAMTEIPGELSTYGSKMGLTAFQNLTDVAKATEEFEKSFERAGKPNMSARINAAHGYYDQFHGITSGGSDIVSYAIQFVGNPYVYGGNSLTDGIDCSGFVTQVLINTGYLEESYYPRIQSTSFQTEGYGISVGTDIANALPGDVIVWNGHVAIYMGNGQIVHAANPNAGIKISTVSEQSGLGEIIGIRRFTKLKDTE